MTDTERLRWIDLVARAVRIMTHNARGTLDNAAQVEWYAWHISLMASMSLAFIERNIGRFNDVQAKASEIVTVKDMQRLEGCVPTEGGQ